MSGKVTFDYLPGYQFLKCVTRTPLLEQWVAMAPDGRMRSVKFVTGMTEMSVFPPRHLLYIAGMKNIRHPRLASVEAVINDTGRFVIVSDWTGETLRDRLRQCRADRKPGVPRDELLRLLIQVVEGLEVLEQKHSLHHLCLDPVSILLQQGEALVADFGLVEMIWSPAGQPMANVNPRYAAPELFEDRFSQTSDQYSLALIYLEMFLGDLPQEGHTVLQWKMVRLRETPILKDLPEDDRPILARALERDPRKRYASAREFIAALEEATPRKKEDQLWLPYAYRPTPLVTDVDLSAATRLVPPGASYMIGRAVQAAAESMQVKELEGMRCLVQPDGSLFHRCAAWLPKGMVYPKLEGLLNQWEAQITQNADDLLVFRLSPSRSFIKKILSGGRRDFEVQIRLLAPRVAGSQLTEVTVWLRYLGKDRTYGHETLAQLGPSLLSELRHYLLAMPEQRSQERFPFDYQLEVSPIFDNGETAAPVLCQGKDISRLGISFYAPGTPPTILLYLQANAATIGHFVLPVRVMRVKPIGQYQCEIGCRFLGQGSGNQPALQPGPAFDLNAPDVHVR